MKWGDVYNKFKFFRKTNMLRTKKKGGKYTRK